MASASPPAPDRSCVILATNDYSNHTYTLHHIDVAPFFSRPDPDTHAMDDGIPLPPASARFDRPPDARGCSLEFHLLRGCERDAGVKVVSTDAERRTIIYNVARRAVRGGPMMRATKDSPVSVAVGDGLFVLERRPASGHRRFEALRYDPLLASASRQCGADRHPTMARQGVNLWLPIQRINRDKLSEDQLSVGLWNTRQHAMVEQFHTQIIEEFKQREMARTGALSDDATS